MSHLPSQLTTDYPETAYERAMRAFDAFDVCAAEYRALLDTQRAMRVSENFDGTLRTMMRGDDIVQRVTECGARIAPTREALSRESYQGPRADALRRRLDASGTLAEVIGTLTARASAACTVRRDTAAITLSEERTAQKSRGGAAYTALDRSTTAIDIRR